MFPAPHVSIHLSPVYPACLPVVTDEHSMFPLKTAPSLVSSLTHSCFLNHMSATYSSFLFRLLFSFNKIISIKKKNMVAFLLSSKHNFLTLFLHSFFCFRWKETSLKESSIVLLILFSSDFQDTAFSLFNLFIDSVTQIPFESSLSPQALILVYPRTCYWASYVFLLYFLHF